MIYLFWDKANDELEVLGEDGKFYLYGEDKVAREQGLPNWQYWVECHPMQNVAPLNEWERYDFLHPKTGEWIPWADVYHDKELLMEVHRHARDPDWREARFRA